jgi:hypothetical protein
MTTSQQYRSKAIESADLAMLSKSSEEQQRFARAARAYAILAENEDWLAANANRLVPAGASREDRANPS